MNRRSIVVRTTTGLGLVVCLMAALAGCRKEDARPVPAVAEAAAGHPKIPPFFLGSTTNNGSYAVYEWTASCVTPYGTITPNPRSDAPNSLVVTGPPTYIRVQNTASCTPDASYLRLLRGKTLNSFGPWYLIRANFGPPVATRTAIKIRVKNISFTVPGHDYDQGISYDDATNTWDVTSAISSGNYDIQVVTPGIMALCP